MTLDRAFDRGLITVDRARRIHVSRQLRESRSRETRDYFQQFEKATLRPAARFDPEPERLRVSSGTPRPQEHGHRPCGTERVLQKLPLRLSPVLIVTRMGRDHGPGPRKRIE